MNRSWSRIAAAFLAALLLAAACSETTSSDDGLASGSDDETGTTAAGDDGGSSTTGAAGDSVVGSYAGQDWYLGTVPDAPVAADTTLTPVKIGLINQENSPAGSYPEITAATEAGVEFINQELGGVDGNPIELHTCPVTLDPAESQACAQELIQEGVVALVGGIDVSSSGSIPILIDNGVPQIGGIPATLDEQTSENHFFFSGGTAGASAAFLQHAQENGATKVFLAVGDFPSFTIAANEYAVPVAESLGLELEIFTFDLFANDFLPILTAARDSGAEAVVVLAADSACVNVISDFDEVVGADKQLYMTGACAVDEITDAVGDAMEIAILNNEGPNGSTTEGDIYNDVVDRYATSPALGAGTVGFRGLMNLYANLLAVGPEATSQEILDHVRTADEEPSFWGHPYTCDGAQVPGLQALCAPQQTLMQFDGDDLVDAGGGWIDTVALFQQALG